MTQTEAPQRITLEVAELSGDYVERDFHRMALDAEGVALFRRVPVAAVQDGTVVSSLTTTGLHAPALDVDLPSALTTSAAGELTLWVDGLTATGWRRARRALAAAGLADPSADHDPAGHRDQYEAERDRAIDESSRVAMLTRTGPALSCSFAQAMQLASVTTSDTRTPDAGRPITRGADMANPRPLRLRVPADLLPSTRNHHLYLQAELPWPAYRKLLRALAAAGLLERGYVGASEERQATHLRLPWVHKTAEQLDASSPKAA